MRPPRYAHALSLNKAEDKVSGLMFELLLHIVKLRLYPGHQSTNHWVGEVDTWLLAIQDWTTNVKTPAGRVKAGVLANWMVPFARPETMVGIKRVTIGKYGPPGADADLSDTQARLVKAASILTNPVGQISDAIQVLTA